MSTTSRRKGVTMYDVAALAGVSHQTVSRVINEHDSVRPATRAKVLAAMAELGYRPSATARSLAARRTHTLGLISFELPLYGPFAMLQGVERAARARGYSVISVSFHAAEREGVQAAIDELLRRDVEGLVVVAPRDGEAEALGPVDKEVPVVALMRSIGAGVALVGSDNVAGGAAVAEHLLALGHRRLAHVAGPPDFAEADQRTQGWLGVLRRAGVTSSPTVAGDWSAASGYLAGCRIVEDGWATGVFVANDQMALGLYTAFAQAGVRIPQDVSVVGYDNQAESAWYFPALTTVEQEFARVGEAGIRRVMDLIDGSTDVAAVQIPPRLVVRQSTAAPRT